MSCDSEQIWQAIRRKHSGNCTVVGELPTGTGSRAERRIDVWVMADWPGEGNNRRTAYEIKVSRGDFLRELKQPIKRRPALFFSNFFYFATPEGLLNAADLPPEAGLVEVRWQVVRPAGSMWNSQAGAWMPVSDEWGWACKTVVQAPYRDSLPPTWNFVAALIRTVRERPSAFTRGGERDEAAS